MVRFIKTTILGGILFLVPIVIFLTIIAKAFDLSNLIAAPLAERLFVDSVGGFAVVHILAAAILIAICFIAGLAAKTTVAKNLVTALENSVLEKIPAYELLKTKSQSVLTPEEIKTLRPAIIRFDDSWQLAFEIERLADGKAVVFLPGSPDPWSGSVCVVTLDRVTMLDVPVLAAVNWMKRLGRGATDILQSMPAFHEPKP